MLNVLPTNDKPLLDRLSQTLFGGAFPGGVGFVLFANGEAAGLAWLKITEEVSVIERLGILPAYRGSGYGDFFTRVLLDRLSSVSKEIIVRCASPYYVKFGFQREGDAMRIRSERIEFPSKCKE